MAWQSCVCLSPCTHHHEHCTVCMKRTDCTWPQCLHSVVSAKAGCADPCACNANLSGEVAVRASRSNAAETGQQERVLTWMPAAVCPLASHLEPACPMHPPLQSLVETQLYLILHLTALLSLSLSVMSKHAEATQGCLTSHATLLQLQVQKLYSSQVCCAERLFVLCCHSQRSTIKLQD